MNKLIFVILFCLVFIKTFAADNKPEAKTAGVFDIAFALDGTLVQGVPAANISLFSPEIIIKTSKRSYMIRSYATELLTKLIKQKYRIHIIAKEDLELAKEIAKLIVFKDLGNKTLLDLATTINGSESAPEGEFDLKVTKANLSHLVFIASEGFKVKADQTINYQNLGPYYYAYPSFEQANKQRKEGSTFFPKTAEEWTTEYYKLGRVALLLKEANSKDIKSYIENSDVILKNDEAAVLNIFGIEQLQGIYKDVGLDWVTKKTTIEGKEVLVADGCIKLDRRKHIEMGAVDISECINSLPINFKLIVTGDKKNPTLTCTAKPTNSNVELANVSIQKCIEKDKSLRYFWKEPKKTSCAIHTSDLIEIKKVESKNCGEEFIYTDFTDGRSYIYKAFKNFDKLSNDQLYQAVKTRPTFENPVQLFEPWNDLKDDGIEPSECIQAGERQTMKHVMENDQETIDPKCRPDTLYSWGPKIKVDEWLQTAGPNQKVWPKQIRKIFTIKGPMTTFGYGIIPIRIKLKKGVHFVPGSATCGADPMAVYYRRDGMYSDWLICSTEVIHSWSFYTPENYDEIIKEYQRIKKFYSNLLGHVEIYAMLLQPSDFFGSRVDSYDFTESNFLSRLKAILSHTLNNEGQISYNPDLPAKEKTPAAHFSTSHPQYYNEQ